MQRKPFILIISLLILALGLSAIARAQISTPGEVDSPVGTSFTYQGQLKDASGLVTGNCDLQLSLWDALTAGAQIGSTLTKSGVAVSEGLFTVQLDFGANAFSGSARWLAIAVRCPAGSGSYATLSPRQPLTPAPYALYSANADTVDGQHASAFQQHYQNLLVVAKSGGDYTTITDALNSITTNSAANPFTIYVAPGVYTETVTMKPYVDIEGAGELATKITYIGSSSMFTGTVVGADNAELRFLTVENTGGASEAVAIYNDHASPHLTHVTASASGGTGNKGVYNYISSPTMTNVTATASGGASSYGVYNQVSSSTMTNVTATASGGTDNYGVFNDQSNTISSPTMTNVTAIASGGTRSCGVENNLSSPTMMNVTAIASGGTNNQGVKNQYQSSPTMMNVTVTASGGTANLGVANAHSSSPTMTSVIATASGGTYGYGVYNESGSSPTMMNVVATAPGGTNGYGVWNSSSSVTIQNSILSGNGSYTGDGIHNTASSGSYTVKVNNSQIIGGSSTIYSDSSYYTTQIGASQLIGGGVQGSGNYICVASYKANYTALDNTCH